MPLNRDELEDNRLLAGVLSYACGGPYAYACGFRVEGPVWAVIPVIRDHEAVHAEGWI